MKNIPFNKLVAPERDYIAYELSPFSPELIGIYQPLKKNYRIELQYMDAGESRQGISDEQELLSYLDVLNSKVDVEVLQQKTGVLDYVDSSNSKKRSLTQNDFLPLSLSLVQKIVKGKAQSCTECVEIALGFSQGVTVFLCTHYTLKLNINDLYVSRIKYDAALALLVKRYKESVKPISNSYVRLKNRKNHRLDLSPVLTAALTFTLRHGRLPRRIDSNLTDEPILWSLMVDEFGAFKNGNEEVIDFDGARIRYDDVWRVYRQTESKYLVQEICNSMN
ncbi:hypothetical protein GTH32_18110 [Alteromonas sp. 345S023]|uniref:Uncharacterized protein n=1 Tax=Alteromonas profundi TaxID=2696062 RepID=A0A7X5LPD0_9ALTE|nr:hypothetical protein [Alteromonas profundi]NDV93086.1 hypothetical protein [Alteromonas profundi]